MGIACLSSYNCWRCAYSVRQEDVELKAGNQTAKFFYVTLTTGMLRRCINIQQAQRWLRETSEGNATQNMYREHQSFVAYQDELAAEIGTAEPPWRNIQMRITNP